MSQTATLVFGAGLFAVTSNELSPNTWILVASALLLVCLGLFLLEFFIPSLGLIMILNSYFVAVVSVPFSIFIYLLEIFVAFLQAYIFTLLSALFIGMGIHEEQEAH